MDGWLLGSWAMDASQGYLRVGTTSEGPAVAGGDGTGLPAPGADPATSSSVVVLRETDGGLVEAGRADGLGPGEQIRSLRWFDDLAVVVTFRQTDPLYTVDLADPTAPRVLGELKVTGYSGYLHPVGDNVFLGVGQAGDEAGTLLGAKVETYDVADLAARGVVGDLVWPGASTAGRVGQPPVRLPARAPDRRAPAGGGTTRSRAPPPPGLVAVVLAEDGTPVARPGGGPAAARRLDRARWPPTDDIVVVPARDTGR